MPENAFYEKSTSHIVYMGQNHIVVWGCNGKARKLAFDLMGIKLFQAKSHSFVKYACIYTLKQLLGKYHKQDGLR